MGALARSKPASNQHIPVLLSEITTAIDPRDGEVYVDGTFGAGGYARSILTAANCRVIAIDRDPDAIKRAEAFKAEFGDRFEILNGRFGEMTALLSSIDVERVNGIVLDIGVMSAFQAFSWMKQSAASHSKRMVPSI